MPACSLDTLRNQHLAVQMRFSALQGQAKDLNTRRTQLAKEISLAKGRIELAPEAMKVFTYLQEKAHARAVGDFEDLLSAFVSDVIPDAGKIRLELGTDRNAPSLDILLDNGGDVEDIYSGNGGGLTNVVVTALGFSALSRTSNRQLMLLDEPDCWLKSVNVPAFTKVIAEVANPRSLPDGTTSAGCQTLMVSHNDVSLMDEGAHLQDIRVERDLAAYAARLGAPIRYVGDETACAHVVWIPSKDRVSGHIEVRYRPEVESDPEQNALTRGFAYVESISGARAWEPELPGLRWLEVQNLRRHVFTRLDLSSGLNVLTGDVNSGKSTLLFVALRAMAYGETDDSQLRHGADEAVIRLGLENDVVLEMVRSRKGSPKVMFRRYEAGVLTNEGRQETRGGVPAFIGDTLKIHRVDELDVQLRHQKQPVFLLNESPTRRARLLSVGRESGLLQALIEKHRTALRADKDRVRRDEGTLNEMSRTLGALAPLASLGPLNEILVELLTGLQSSLEKEKQLRAALAKLEQVQGTAQLATAVAGDIEALPAAPVLKDASTIVRAIQRIERHAGLARLPLPGSVPVASKLQDTSLLASVISQLSKTDGLRLLPIPPGVPTAPALGDAAGLAALVRKLVQYDLGALRTLLPAEVATPSQKDVSDLVRVGLRLGSLATQLEELAQHEAAATAELVAAQQAVDELKRELGCCPVCDQAFTGFHHHDQV